MKIVLHQEFLTLPSGTVFAKIEPYMVGELGIKHETLEESSDFFYESLQGVEGFHSMVKGNQEHAVLGLVQLDGCFDDTQQYVIWSSSDVQLLMDRLSTTITI
jgi:hypothetical protein